MMDVPFFLRNARDLDLHIDGRRLAVAGFDGVARIFDMPARTL